MGPTITKHRLIWTPPTTNFDGTPLDDLGGYFVYWKTSSTGYNNVDRKDISKPQAPIYDLLDIGLPYAKYFIAMTAYDMAGNESVLSEEVPFDANIPGSPTGLQIS